MDISTRQINRIISENKDMYHREKDMILSTGLKFSSYINVDDTGPDMMAKMVIAPISATNFLHGLKVQKAKIV